MADTLLDTIAGGTGYDFVDIYYSTSAGTGSHSVKVWANYRKTAGTVQIGYQSEAYIKVGSTTTCSGQAASHGGPATFNNILGPGTTSVSHTASTSVTISYKIYILGSNYVYKWVTGSKSITLPALTSACSAPTSCTVSPAIVVPGGKVTVSWSGAKAGNNNAISGYDVVLNGKTVSVSSTSTSGSTTFTNLSSRGSSYSAKVRTKGKAGSSYYSGYKTSSNSVKVNTLPKAPTISGSNQTIAYNATAPSFTLKKGSDSDSGQTIYLCYNTSNSHTGQTQITGSASVTLNPAQGASKIVYAWTYDGLEYNGSAVSRKVTRETAPPPEPDPEDVILKNHSIKFQFNDAVYNTGSTEGFVVSGFRLSGLSAEGAFDKYRLYYKRASSIDGLETAGWSLIKEYDYGEYHHVYSADNDLRLSFSDALSTDNNWYAQLGVKLHKTQANAWTDYYPFDEIFISKKVPDVEISYEYDEETKLYIINVVFDEYSYGDLLMKKLGIQLSPVDSGNIIATFLQLYHGPGSYKFVIPRDLYSSFINGNGLNASFCIYGEDEVLRSKKSTKVNLIYPLPESS